MERWEPRIGTAAFLAIFPGYFAYHTLVSRGFMPRFLGGYLTAVALLLLPVVTVAYARRVRRDGDRVPAFDAAFFGFLALLVLVTLGNLVAGANPEITTPNLSSAILFAAIYLAIRLLDLDSPAFRRAAVGAFLFVTALVYWNATDPAFLLSMAELEAAGERLADYGGFGFVYMVLLVFAAGVSRSAPVRLLAYGVAIPGLFLNGARSEFAALFLGLLVVEFCYAASRARLVAIVAAVAGGLLVVARALQGFLEEQFPTSRVVALVAAGSDESTSERIRHTWRAWHTVGEHPFLGSFGSYAVGEYAHNALSAWVDLGLVGFLYYLALLLVPLVLLLRRFAEDSRRTDYVLALSLTGILVVLSAVAKDYTYRLFPIAMALFADWQLAQVPVEADAVPGEAGEHLGDHPG